MQISIMLVVFFKIISVLRLLQFNNAVKYFICHCLVWFMSCNDRLYISLLLVFRNIYTETGFFYHFYNNFILTSFYKTVVRWQMLSKPTGSKMFPTNCDFTVIDTLLKEKILVSMIVFPDSYKCLHSYAYLKKCLFRNKIFEVRLSTRCARTFVFENISSLF